MHTTPGKKAVLDGILTFPMVIPPTAAGFFLLLLFSRRRPLGILLYEQFDIKVVQNLAWLYHRGDGDRLSADVPQCQSCV